MPTVREVERQKEKQPRRRIPDIGDGIGHKRRSGEVVRVPPGEYPLPEEAIHKLSVKVVLTMDIVSEEKLISWHERPPPDDRDHDPVCQKREGKIQENSRKTFHGR